MRRNLIVSAALLVLAMAGCAKQPATMPASATAPAPSSMSGSRPQSTAGQSGAGGGASLGAVTGSAAGAATDRPSPRDFSVNAALRDINFDFDKYEIRPGDAKILDASAAWLKSNPRNLLLIEGHTDERGTAEYNLALGERRAKAAMSYLVALGIQTNRIAIISYGSEHGLCKERGEACWARNRRDHFLVKPE
ncbi:MAG TPA: OmpA family protein [Methylomirabilota bacterium]|jgi:peptidoglycan-associated lipoprotein